MKEILHMKRTTKIVCSVLAVIPCFTLLLGAYAVVPAPDGGYPNFTTAEGTKALQSLTTGAANTAAGWYSLFTNDSGSYNTGVGAGTLALNTGDFNTATGTAALLFNTTGVLNTANGSLALFSNTAGAVNTAIGDEALYNNTTGRENTAAGYQALYSNTTGGFNTAIGLQALQHNTTGGENVAIGFLAGTNVTTANGVVSINASGANIDNTTWIGGIYNVTPQSGVTLPVVISNNLQLGTSSSSRRFKKEIEPMGKASESLLGLKPVTFHYKNDTTNTQQFGLIAEEVADRNPDLVVYGNDGKPYTVRYDAVNVMLLNEFLKQHKAFVEQQNRVAEQGATIARLEQQVTTLTAGLQKVTAQLQLKSAPQTVLNHQ
jgi:hypothetical protein